MDTDPIEVPRRKLPLSLLDAAVNGIISGSLQKVASRAEEEREEHCDSGLRVVALCSSNFNFKLGQSFLHTLIQHPHNRIRQLDLSDIDALDQRLIISLRSGMYVFVFVAFAKPIEAVIARTLPPPFFLPLPHDLPLSRSFLCVFLWLVYH